MKREYVDVLVVGSGAGGLATAVAAAHRGLTVIVAEKEPVFGGTTARSGGWMWIPNNGPAVRAGIQDSVDKARTYLKHETGEHYDSARVEAFLEAGPRAVDFFEKHTALQFDLGPTFADYHPTAPGGMDAGRSIVARPFDGRELGPEIKRLRPPLREITVLGMMIGSGKELLHFFNVTRSLVSMVFVTGLVARFARDMLFHGRAMRLMNGNALVARLARSAFDKGVPIWTSSPVRSLLRDDRGAVTGAIVNRPDGPVEIHTRKGVVLAAGGFPQDAVRRKALMPHAPSGHEHVSPAPPGNTGDGLRLGESAGGVVDTSLPHSAAWVPISRPPNGDGTLGTFPHFVDRSKPGVIAITRSGRRFVNEAQSYHDFCQAMVRRCQDEGGPNAENAAWFVADHRAFRRYGLGYAKPSPVPYKHLIRQGYLIRGRTPAELATRIGADPQEFERTIRRFNQDAARGEDPEFGKGSTAYNRSLGDPDHKPNPCVAPLDTGPYYAVRVHVGDLGTFAGLKTNEYAEVLDDSGKPVGGLYSAGNDAASIMGGNYPGGGITLGPAITFGYIAARRMAGAND
ncbi:MAG: FAD-dependent oxidoreductase [Rhodobacter sp.]|uniref:FAD-dependent oxidoreductase n=1 Tax=Pararhodobacter sp. TaxID=2127056 RepID=UPI001DB49B7F|nr:FAD-dependent oxidoreductase [Pararhodobacter sp.]MCB1344866.1 FAD-dependent oxidoreductase [Paracoccaceae bacterium]MCC0072673.1 FAD-dependent oxidoreductase [Rhodobacter sp.]HPD94168.1 FAD-dependent oxidoreductase [Pararhodobacter sp.]